MHVLYQITYKPHLETNYPKYYVGSKHNWNRHYKGSVASNKVFDYTNGLSLKDWWKAEWKKDPSQFLVTVIKTFDDITPSELVLEEKQLQEEMGVLGDDYFNQCVAAKGFFSVANSEETKQLKSVKTKAYWDSAEGQLKRQRLTEHNKLVKSDQLKARWKDPTAAMLDREISGRPKGAKDIHPRKQRPERIVAVGEITFPTAKAASIEYNVTPTAIRFRCRTNFKTHEGTWRYI